ncbi:hypothetical protein [Sulfuriflexus mobilis]|uniref:hypothetical protein n=1 Tax=Sulfuriflexus mobilis TaxID=1811807 RepID=UPI000F83132F|nr:hypothetical protein [Sulfuriflexus mobilis]
MENKQTSILESIELLLAKITDQVTLLNNSNIDWIGLCTLFAIVIGLGVAIKKFKAEFEWRKSEVYLEQAKELYQLAYNALIIDESTNYPVNNRRVWLTSARRLLAAEAMSKKITEESHKISIDEYIEYWRVQFSDLLSFDSNDRPASNKEYFYEKGALYHWSDSSRAPIHESSIAVIYRFMKWNEDRENYLKNVDDFNEDEIHRMEIFDARGVGAYIREIRKRDEKE